jgi:ABC-type Fe3+ transport system permease subunit
MGATHEAERSVEHKPLGEVPPVDAEGRKQNAGLLALCLVTAGGIISVFWGSWDAPSAYREHWGRSAATGAVTTALLAGLTAACAIAFVAPGLRAERKRGRREPSRLRKVVRPLLTALSFVTLYLLARAR